MEGEVHLKQKERTAKDRRKRKRDRDGGEVQLGLREATVGGKYGRDGG